jgi:hypothetical protein
MPTTVTVRPVDGGNDVKVSWKDPTAYSAESNLIVPAGEERVFYVHSSATVLIHEIQPDEVSAEATKA